MKNIINKCSSFYLKFKIEQINISEGILINIDRQITKNGIFKIRIKNYNDEYNLQSFSIINSFIDIIGNSLKYLAFYDTSNIHNHQKENENHYIIKLNILENIFSTKFFAGGLTNELYFKEKYK